MNSKRITHHVILACTKTRDRGLRMQTILSKLGFKVIESTSAYDAQKISLQEMPHLIVTESLLSDGDCSILFDHCQNHPFLKDVPIIVNIIRKTKEELTPIAKRPVAGVLLGIQEPKALAIKVLEVLAKFSGLSPHFRPSQGAQLKGPQTLAVDASVIGISGQCLVAKSTTEIDCQASMICVPDKSSLGPALLNRGTNVKGDKDILNLFPLHKILGRGRTWIEKLPRLDSLAALSGKMKSPTRKVLFFDPDEERCQEFSDILTGYDFEIVPAHSMEATVRSMRAHQDFDLIFLSELVNDKIGIEWKETFQKINAGERKVPALICTNATGLRSTEQIRYLKRPFGLGFLVESLELAIEGIRQSQSGNSSPPGINVKYKTPCSIVGLDERGGILEIQFPVLPGAIFNLENQLLREIWNGVATIRIDSVTTGQSKTGGVHAHFEAVGAEMSKGRYIEKLRKIDG